MQFELFGQQWVLEGGRERDGLIHERVSKRQHRRPLFSNSSCHPCCLSGTKKSITITRIRFWQLSNYTEEKACLIEVRVDIFIYSFINVTLLVFHIDLKPKRIAVLYPVPKKRRFLQRLIFQHFIPHRYSIILLQLCIFPFIPSFIPYTILTVALYSIWKMSTL